MAKTNPSKSPIIDFAKVEALIEMGITVTRACRNIGVPRSSYYAWKNLQTENAPGSETHEGCDCDQSTTSVPEAA